MKKVLVEECEATLKHVLLSISLRIGYGALGIVLFSYHARESNFSYGVNIGTFVLIIVVVMFAMSVRDTAYLVHGLRRLAFLLKTDEDSRVEE